MEDTEWRFAFGDFLFDSRRGSLCRNGAAMPIGLRGMRLLQALLDAKGQVVDKTRLFELAWPGLVVDESNLSVQISALRKLLGRARDGTDWIVTVPRLGYRIVGATLINDAATQASPHAPTYATGALDQRPSIIVLPFSNLSTDPAQEYFADGITDDVIAALTKFRWFSVTCRSTSYTYKARQVDAREIGRELGVRYLVHGSVRKAADRLRISVELVDAAEGLCRWAEHYDFDMTDIFAVHDQIAWRIVGSVEPELLKSESYALIRQQSESITAWDLVARACTHFHNITQTSHLHARELLRHARQIDPELAEVWIWLARVSAGILAFGWTDDVAGTRHEGLEAAHLAVNLDDKNCYAHYSLAIMSVMSEAFDLAIQSAGRTIDINPGFALGHLVLGMAQLYSGNAESAIVPLEEGLELNRHDPHNFIWYNVLALSLLFSGKADAALKPTSMSLKIRPQWRSSMETLAACHAELGQAHAAKKWRGRLSELPIAPGDALAPLWRCNPHWAARMQALLSAKD